MLPRPNSMALRVQGGGSFHKAYWALAAHIGGKEITEG